MLADNYSSAVRIFASGKIEQVREGGSEWGSIKCWLKIAMVAIATAHSAAHIAAYMCYKGERTYGGSGFLEEEPGWQLL